MAVTEREVLHVRVGCAFDRSLVKQVGDIFSPGGVRFRPTTSVQVGWTVCHWLLTLRLEALGQYLVGFLFFLRI